MSKKYAVALSYASQHRSLVHGVANRLTMALASRGGRVFYDLYEKAELVGKIDDTLRDAYVKQSDLVVVFFSHHYARSEWCSREWYAIRALMQNPPGGARLLLLALDNYQVKGLKNGYVINNVNDRSEAEISELILGEAGVNPWIVDTRFAQSRLNVLKRKRVEWLFDHELRTIDGQIFGGRSDSQWKAEPLARLCRGRTLDWTGPSALNSLAKNMVVLCGERGSGKSVLMLRAVASAGKQADIPAGSWLIDFGNNARGCTNDEAFTYTAADELARFLDRVLSRAGGAPQHILLMIDGLDSAARQHAVARDEAEAPKLVVGALASILAKLRECGDGTTTSVQFTVVLSLNAIDPRRADQGEWQEAFDELKASGAVFATLAELPPVDAISYASLYRHHLSLKRKTPTVVAEYIGANRDFLRLPLFLDAASTLDSRQLTDTSTRTGFLRRAREKRGVQTWPNELDELMIDLEAFISLPAAQALDNEKLRALLRPEWTGAWLQLLTECMRSEDRVLGFVSDLKRNLLSSESWRWDLTASFALSNVVTALSEAGHPPTFDSVVRYCNLRRATLDHVVFGGTSTFHGVDCSGARLREVTFANGCKFVATDFTDCVWDSRPKNGGPAAFVECLGL